MSTALRRVKAIDDLRAQLIRAPQEIESGRQDLGDMVPGDIACGLAFDLGASQARTEGSWGVLLDWMLDRGGESALAALELGNRLGLAVRGSFDKRQLLGLFSDEEVAAEVLRRGRGVRTTAEARAAIGSRRVLPVESAYVCASCRRFTMADPCSWCSTPMARPTSSP